MGKAKLPDCVQLDPEFNELLDKLDDYSSEIDERLLETTGKGVGFYSTDDKVYKLIGCLVEKFVDDVFYSTNHIHMKDIKGISKRIKEAQKEERLPLKRLQSIKNNQMSGRVLSLKDLLPELENRGVNIAKTTSFPESELTNRISEKRG